MDPILNNKVVKALDLAYYVLNPQQPKPEPSAPTRVLVETAPFAKLVAEGEKSLIIQANRLDIEDEPLFLGDADQAYAIVTVGSPFALSLQQFTKSYDDHLISEELRREFWPKARRLWGYRVKKLEILEQPQVFVAALPPGVADRPGFRKAVANPTPAQRKDLPDAAYAWVGKGTDGKKRHILPHHTNAVKDPKENTTVDKPKLRNAFARINQVKGVPRSAIGSSLSHLRGHAKEAFGKSMDEASVDEIIKALEESTTLVVEQPVEQKHLVTKSGVFIMSSEAGAHPHIIAKNNISTESDGAHSHLFKLTDGSLVATRVDGAHAHTWQGGAERTPAGAEHDHALVLPSGARLQTKVSNGHAHDLLMRTTGLDGVHKHEVALEDGTVLKSLSPAEFRELSRNMASRFLDATEKATTSGERAALSDGRAIDIAVHKGDGPEEEEHFVLGVVLEPDIVDSQGDTYDEKSVRYAAHFWMEKFAKLKLMHKGSPLGKKVSILESYVTMAPFEISDTVIKKGTWLLALRVNDGTLWSGIKAGELTGFSIGGTALFEVLDESDSFGLSSPGA